MLHYRRKQLYIHRAAFTFARDK
jgi:hypothetical protein